MNFIYKQSFIKIILLKILLVTLCLLPDVAAKMYTHQLQHQSAEQVLPSIRPHLSSNTKISAKGNTLFIDTTEKEYEKIQQMLNMIDKPRGEYMVDVWILNRKLDQYETQSAELRAKNRVFKGQSKRYQTQSSDKDEKRFSLRLSEGFSGFVNAGETFFTNKLVNHYQEFIPQTSKHKVNSGFFVIVNEAGQNRVKVRLSAQAQTRNNPNNAQRRESKVSNMVTGVKGNWILIASINADNKTQQSKSYTTQSRRETKRWYYLRVSDIIK